jgi:hypothetical protein
MSSNNVLSESIKNMNELGEYRRMRLLKSREHIPDIIWIVLIMCSFLIIVFTFFFAVKNLKHQFLMTSILIFISVIILYLIYVLDHPFVWQYKISTDTFKPIMSYIRDYSKQ